MIRLLNPYLILGLIALVVGAWTVGGVQGYRQGAAAVEARVEAAREAMQRELFKAGEELSRQGAELAALKADQDQKVREFEDEARGNLGDARPGIGADGMRSLDQLWGAP
jgi:hypothetical protein